MAVDKLLEMMDPHVYQTLCYAVETGRWEDGTRLTKEQRDHCMQAVMIYQSKHNHDPQHMTVAAGGEMSLKSKGELKRLFAEQGTQDDIVRVNPNLDS